MERSSDLGLLPAAAMTFFAELVPRLPELTAPGANARPLLDRVLPLVQAIRQSQPPDTMFAFMAASLLRRIGHSDEALALAREAYQLDPGYHAAVAVAAAFGGGWFRVSAGCVA